MTRSLLLPIVLAAMLFAGPASVTAGELAGVTLPDTVTVEGTTLRLNGIGLREATMLHVKAYVGGLYLETPTHDGQAVIDSTKLQQVTMVFLRGISKGQLASGWGDSLRAVAPAEEKAIARFMSLIPDVETKDRLEFTFRPGRGVEIRHNEKSRGEIEGESFAKALLTVWFGPKPGDPNLKKGMLGD